MNNEKTTTPTRPYLVNLLTKRQQHQLDVLIGLWFILVTWFMFWWWEPKHCVDLFHTIFNSVIICWGMILPAYYFYFLRRMKKPNPELKIPVEWRVAMVVTRAPAEPFAMVKEMLFAVHRCFVWIGLESNYSWNSHVEFAGSLVGDGSEVDEVPESTSHSFC